MKTKALIISLLALSMGFASCSKSAQKKQQEEKVPAFTVSVQALKSEKMLHTQEYSINLQGKETVKVSPSMQGKIERIFVKEGDYVNKGQDLLRMDQTQYRSTKLAYDNLVSEMGRMDQLLKTGSVTQQAYDQLKTQLNTTKENLDFLKENTYVKSVISGYVSAKNYEEGELFAGTPIVVVTQINPLKALVSIPESYFPYVKKGSVYTVKLDMYKDKQFEAKVRVVYPTIDAMTHTFKAELILQNKEMFMRPGMFARVSVDIDEVDAIIAPYQCVMKMQGSNTRYVFISDNGKAKRVVVEMGQRFDDQVELISSELREGDAIIIKGQGKLVDGSEIQVVK